MGRRAYGSKTRSKKSATEVLENEQPTEEAFERMTMYGSFVMGNNGTEVTFEKDQVVLILPHGSDPEKEHELSKYWAARIKDIRAQEFDDKSNIVWVRVQWFYSGKDVSDVIKSFDPMAVGPFERIYSDHHDFVQAEAFEMVIPMYKLNEVNHEQIFIPKDSFYRRYTFEYLARNLQPKPGLMTCVCQRPYNPNDTDPERLMHFCPRPSCRKAFHHNCLMGLKSKESSMALLRSFTVKIPSFSDTPKGSMHRGDTVKVTRSARKHAAPPRKTQTRKAKEDEDEAEVARAVLPSSSKTRSGPQQSSILSPRALRLLGCSPDTDDNLDLQSLVYNVMDVDSETDNEPERQLRRKGRRGRPSGISLDSVLKTIPPDLLTIAIQPLVRGSAFVAGGVAGNIGMVTKARRLVYTALQMGSGKHVVADWKETVFGKDREVVDVGLKNAVVTVTFEDGQAKKDKGLPPFVCPNCKSAI